MNFLDKFWQMVHQYPDRTAVVDLASSRHTTYRELYMQSGRAAAKLLKSGDMADRAVLICMDRRMEYVAAEIGIMMSGAAFVPLLLEYPKERTDDIKEDCRAVCTIDAAWMADTWKYAPVVKSEAPDCDRAMIIYAPGSDGRLEGIVYSHASLYAEAMRHVQEPGFEKEEQPAAAAPASFSAAVLECFTALASGGCVYISNML